MEKLKRTVVLAVLGFGLHHTAQAADAAVGVGFSYVFGEGAAVGIKLFSDDKPHHVVGALGVEYLFDAKTFRPTLGPAYLGDNYYVDASLGWNFRKSEVDYGLGAGWADTDDSRDPDGASGGVSTGDPIVPIDDDKLS